ncbi:MAG TPA: glycine cleavage system protein GcvH [Chlamydiales bacterium]|nr:glycine cleavage system protein GcvH [Chlamydiales bacterium]
MRYTDFHEWISLDGNRAKVGITKYAQQELGEVVYVELPKVGQMIKAGEEICVLESTKSAVDVYAPCSGEIVAVHDVLHKNPHALNEDPEGFGWIFEIQLSDPKELDHLLSAQEYAALVT